MRGLAGLGLLGLLITIGLIYLMVGGGTSGGDATVIAVAAGKVPSGAFELHVGVEFAMTRTEAPKLKGPGSTWPEWVNEHFKLVDASGKTVPLARVNHSRLMTTQGTWEFFLSAPVTPGATYELTYKPYRDSSQCYRHKLQVPETGLVATRMNFEPG